MPPRTSGGLKPIIVYLRPEDVEEVEKEAESTASSASQVCRSVIHKWADAKRIPTPGQTFPGEPRRRRPPRPSRDA